MQGLAQGQQAAAMWANLIGYYTGRHNEGERNRALLETMASPGGSGQGTQVAQAPGYNPMSGGQDGEVPPDEDAGPSPAAQRGMQADALRKVIQTYAPEAKDLHTALKGMSVDQLEGIVKGHVMNQAAQEHAARMEDAQAQAELRRQQVMDDQSVGQFLKSYGAAEGAPAEKFGTALRTLPAAGGRVLPKALQAISQYEQIMENGQGWKTQPGPYEGISLLMPSNGRGRPVVLTDPNEATAPGTFQEDEVTGARFFNRGKQVMPSGYNPAKAQPTLAPQHDEDGNLIGWTQTDARGHSVFHQAKSGGLKEATDEKGNVLPGFYTDGQGRLHDTRSALQKAGFGAVTTPAPAAATKYKSADDVKAAVRNKALTREQGMKILKEQFGFE